MKSQSRKRQSHSYGALRQEFASSRNKEWSRGLKAPPLAQVSLLNEPHRGQDGADVVQAALHSDLGLWPLVRGHITADERCSCICQRDRSLNATLSSCQKGQRLGSLCHLVYCR